MQRDLVSLTQKQLSTAAIVYTRDATDRITARTITGSNTAAENGVYNLSYTAEGDAPDIELTATNTILTRTVVLPGGATLTKNYPTPTATAWHYPTIHGDNILSTNNTGTVQGGVSVYDPYGQPLTTAGAVDFDAIVNTNQSAYDHGWLGQHQRGTEHTAGLGYIEMGARVYEPRTGRFANTDPVEGGGSNDYGYPSDPINAYDLDGKLFWFVVAVVVRVAISAGTRAAASAAARTAVAAGRAAVTRNSAHQGGVYIARQGKKLYVGQTNNFNRRFGEHVRSGKLTQAEANSAIRVGMSGTRLARRTFENNTIKALGGPARYGGRYPTNKRWEIRPR